MNIKFYNPISISSCLKCFDNILLKKNGSKNGRLEFSGSFSNGTKYDVEYERNGNYSIGFNLKFGNNYEVDILAYFDEDEDKYESTVSTYCVINRCKTMFGLDINDRFICYDPECTDFVNEFIKITINDPAYTEVLKDNS